jgi:CDP-diacylglycerol pyrophosphatase
MRNGLSFFNGRMRRTVRLAAPLFLFLILSAQSDGPPTVLYSIAQNCSGASPGTSCAFADAKHGYIILKDKRGETQLLLVATQRRWGIEDPHIESADEPNYFEDAWNARSCVSTLAGLKLADNQVSLAINSAKGRSDGQLHIHIDELRPEIVAELAKHPQQLNFNAHTYLVLHYNTLAGQNLFSDLQKRIQRPEEMADETLVVAGDADGGLYVLNDHTHDSDRGSGEELQVAHSKLSDQDFTNRAAKARTCMSSAPVPR